MKKYSYAERWGFNFTDVFTILHPFNTQFKGINVTPFSSIKGVMDVNLFDGKIESVESNEDPGTCDMK